MRVNNHANATAIIHKFLDKNSKPFAPHEIAVAIKFNNGAINGPSFLPIFTRALAAYQLLLEQTLQLSFQQ